MRTKEEILKAAQQEHRDERRLQLNEKAMKASALAGLLAAITLMCLKSAREIPWQDGFVVIGVMAGCINLYRYVFLKEKRDLLYGAVWIVMAVLNLIVYVKIIF